VHVSNNDTLIMRISKLKQQLQQQQQHRSPLLYILL